MTIQVTDLSIPHGGVTYTNCPIQRALVEAGVMGARVGGTRVYVGQKRRFGIQRGRKHTSYVGGRSYLLPPEVQVFISRLIAGKPVESFSFELPIEREVR